LSAPAPIPSSPAIKPALGWVDGDPQGFLSQSLRSMFDESGAFRLEMLEQSKAAEMVRLRWLKPLQLDIYPMFW
jgi:hypothetical protein